MSRPQSALLRLSIVVTSVFSLACAAAPTAPSSQKLAEQRLSRDLVPCDSTIVVDGTCRGGYVIPW